MALAESEWDRAIQEAKALSFRELERYQALVAEVPKLARLEEEAERVILSDDQVGLLDVARRREKALEAHPRIWAARERWRALRQLVETFEARAREHVEL